MAIAAIHMQLVVDEDLLAYRGSKDKVTVELDPIEEILEYNVRNKGTGKRKTSFIEPKATAEMAGSERKG